MAALLGREPVAWSSDTADSRTAGGGGAKVISPDYEVQLFKYYSPQQDVD